MYYLRFPLSKADLSSAVEFFENVTRVPAKPASSKKKGTLFLFISLCSLFVILFVCILSMKLQLPELKEIDYDEDQDENFTFSIIPKGSPVISCYYDMDTSTVKDMTTVKSNDLSQLTPSNIHPHLCTHINIGFGRIKDKQVYLQEVQYKIILEVVNLKKDNPNLKILLSIGGANGHNGFSDMVVDHASRKIFIKSVKYILRNCSLDGIDLDWEFPAVGYQKELQKRERQHFSQLLREIRMEYIREKRNYLLTVAVAAPQIIVDVAYDVDQINKYVDFVNIMTYDFHAYTKYTPFTGLNSPLYQRPIEELYMGTLNINYTVGMYISKGLDRNKIVVGIPTYGHSFTLVNENNTEIGSPAKGFGRLGSLGFVNYPDICKFLNTFENDTKVTTDNNAKVPYLFKDSEWVSYDNPESVKAKAEYIRNNKLRGAMIYSLNADDYNGLCEKLTGSIKFPLAASVRSILNESLAQ